MATPREIVNHMLEKDAFSQWLGIQLVDIQPGFCQLKMIVRKEMLNGHHITHGGISYSLCDTALAFAANSHGQKAVSIETAISHLAPIFCDDTLTVTCKEINLGNTIARYECSVENQNHKPVAKFYGTVYRQKETW